MPNWCGNTLTVTGDDAEIAVFATRVASEESPLSFEGHVAEPAYEVYPQEHCTECDDRGAPAESWVACSCGRIEDGTLNDLRLCWRERHWGTNRDAYDVDLAVSEPGMRGYTFFTAWSPPFAWLREASVQHPELEFELGAFEPGLAVVGRYRIVDGRLLDEDERDVCESSPLSTFGRLDPRQLAAG